LLELAEKALGREEIRPGRVFLAARHEDHQMRKIMQLWPNFPKPQALSRCSLLQARVRLKKFVSASSSNLGLGISSRL
jgi:hypothetical protein